MIGTNDLLIDLEIKNRIKDELLNCQSDVNIISAYCKVSTLEYFDNFISKNVRKRLLVRFLPSDISSGATDKEIYSYCLNNGWELYYDFRMHAKTYIFDKLKCVIGSANFTNNGLGLSADPNTEILSFFSLDDSSYNKILTLYKNSRKVTEDVYLAICKCNSDEDIKEHRPIMEMDEEITVLMPEDFPTNETDLAELYTLKSFIWLNRYLSEKDEHYAYYGELSSKIHDIFIKDPRPYRKDIKAHLSDLLTSIKNNKVDSIEISRPNYSEKISLK